MDSYLYSTDCQAALTPNPRQNQWIRTDCTWSRQLTFKLSSRPGWFELLLVYGNKVIISVNSECNLFWWIC